MNRWNSLIFIFLILSASRAHAYKFVIFTDEPGFATANAYIAQMQTEAPFKFMSDLKYEVHAATTEQLDCQPVIPRLYTCNDDWILNEAAKYGADRAMVVSNSDVYFGSGGRVAVASTNCMKARPDCLTHEFLHTIGFDDEYTYTPDEAAVYCNYPHKFLNSVTIFSQAPYSSDEEAKQKHQSEIPWFNQIKPTTLITSGATLGSPSSTDVGLFHSGVCDNAKIELPTWRPSNETTLMGDLPKGRLGYIPSYYWPIITNAMRVRVSLPSSHMALP